MIKSIMKLAIGCFGSLFVYASANAATVTGTISYFEQPESGAHDFGNPDFCCGAHYSNEVQATLGANGLPVYNSSYGGPAITQLTTGGQLDWWNPSLFTSTVAFTTNSSGQYDKHLFTPNGTGTNNNSAFQTAILTTNSLLANTTYSITYSGDDDVFLALGNSVISQDGGVHAIGQVNSVTFNTGAADNPLEIFFADRYNVESELQFTIAAVPESSTWAMMILGFCGVGFMAYRRNRSVPAFRLI